MVQAPTLDALFTMLDQRSGSVLLPLGTTHRLLVVPYPSSGYKLSHGRGYSLTIADLDELSPDEVSIYPPPGLGIVWSREKLNTVIPSIVAFYPLFLQKARQSHRGCIHVKGTQP